MDVTFVLLLFCLQLKQRLRSAVFVFNASLNSDTPSFLKMLPVDWMGRVDCKWMPFVCCFFFFVTAEINFSEC